MKSYALLVAAGIFLSRIAGLVRERVFAHYFGNSDAGDAFKAALKIPNFLQNMFGEGVLSASFIPVYAQKIALKHNEEAAKVASVVGSLLFLLTSFLVLGGVFATPVLIDLIAPGFGGEKRELTIQIVQILFPGTGFLVMSAWCLGILNSHKRFFLSYVAPVVWNLTIIATLLYYGPQLAQGELAIQTAWGLVLGSFLQFFIQIPMVFRLGGKLWPSLRLKASGVPMVLKNFVPVVFSRGVVQVSAYVDNILASLLPTGAVSSLAYAQTLYLLPVSLFGMSVSAAELPQMSQATGSVEEIQKYLAQRLNRGLQQIGFFVIPSMMGFLILGDHIVAAVFQTGAFQRQEVQEVWWVLAAASLGLLASTMGRLYSSAFYSLKDTRTPLRFAIVRVILGSALGYWGALHLPQQLGLEESWGVPLIVLASGFAGWVEFGFLRHQLNKKIQSCTGLPLVFQFKMFTVSIVAAAAASVCGREAPDTLPVIVRSVLTLGVYGVLFVGLAFVFKVEQVHLLKKKLLRR